ncbi:MYXO-CTERM sorting domain-containing protein [Streptomyces sp. NPDC090036]|uniref:MYXO-CTERM sorting domain-containing protein n=1 Tax=Streptomyces sp. NPDC090036 TaxID=3365926 RepID=UPI00380E662E
MYSFSLADVDVEMNEVFDLQLRMKFGKDTPPSRFSLSTTAEGGIADRVRYESRVTGPDGGAGIALAMGAALVAGTCRRRRPTA